MEAMAQMFGQLAGEMDLPTEEEEGSDARLVRTGRTKTVGRWSAYEVKVEGDPQEEATMWFSDEVGIEWAELLQMQQAHMSAFTSPLMQQMGEGGESGFGGLLDTVQQMLGQSGMPSGFPVQIVSEQMGSTYTMTLKEARREDFSESIFQPPAGYQKMEMPQMPGIR